MRRLTLLWVISFSYLAAFSQAPANDDCAGATVLAVSASDFCENGRTVSLTNATESMPPCTGTTANDVWFRFTATTPTQIIRLWTNNHPSYIVNPVLEVFSGTCGSLTSIVCNNTSINFEMTQTLTNLTPGATYYFRVYSNDPLSTGYQFTICVYQRPANDECSGATQLIVSPTAACANGINTTTVGATASLPPCGGTQSKDVWYKFTAIDTLTVIHLASNGIVNPVMEVFSGSCGNLTSMFCFSKPTHFDKAREIIKGLTIGNEYYVRIYSGSNAVGGLFSVCLYQPEANDECGGAFNIPVNNDTLWTEFVTGSNKNKSPSMDGCSMASINDADGWFKFTAKDTVQLIIVENVRNNSGVNLNMQAYSGDCGNLVVMPIYNPSGQPTLCPVPNSPVTYSKMRGLVPGQVYHLRIMNQYPANVVNNDSFRIKISNPTPNDGVTGAINVNVNVGTTVLTSTQGNMRNASASNPGQAVPLCFQYSEGFIEDVWYTFTAISDRHLFSISSVSRANLEIYTYNAGILTNIACGTGNAGWKFLDLINLTPGTLYYIRVGGGGTFEFSITTPEPTLVNDDCANAQTIPFDHQILSSSKNSTPTANLFTGCNHNRPAPRDLWYSFTPPSDGSAQMRFIVPLLPPYEPNNLGVELYSGSCDNLTRMDCYNITVNGQNVTGLEFTALFGQNYFVRVFSFNDASLHTPFTLYLSSFFNLPVTLTSFEARVLGNKSVKIIWKTDEESGINYYEIERSTDGANFTDIGKVISRNSTTPAEYSGEDISPAIGNNYYRLKIVNQDGKIEYSKIVKVKFKGSFTDNLQLTRQGNDLLINNQSASAKNVTIGVYTATGQKLFSQQKVLSAGINSFNLQGRMTQVLFIKIEVTGEETKTFKLAY